MEDRVGSRGVTHAAVNVGVSARTGHEAIIPSTVSHCVGNINTAVDSIYVDI